jgi:DNA-binding NarL/FixJ family response regulator
MKSKAIADLTKRELEILRLIGEGWNSHQIAQRMFLSPNTVCTHRKNILRKTGARNIISVLIHAVQQRVINVDTLTA